MDEIFKEVILNYIKTTGLFIDEIEINPIKKNGGQSLCFFVKIKGEKKYIAKLFNHLSGIKSEIIELNDGSLKTVDEFVEYISEQSIPFEIDAILTQIYYNKRAFDRYVYISEKTTNLFPKLYTYKSDILIGKSIYGLIIEEFINGITFEEYIKEIDRKQENIEKEALVFLKNISAIIKKYEQLSLVHRDISPDNIIKTDSGIIIIDPGVIKLIDRDSTNIACVMGKYRYASPEQYTRNGKDVDFSSDLYSIGIILYELITGVNLIDKYLRASKLSNTIPHCLIIKNIDRELEDIYYDNISNETAQIMTMYNIIKKLLQVNKDLRFNTVDSFLEAISLLEEV